METLFNEPKQTYRRANGRFATKEMAEMDKVKNENVYLRFEMEKYKRQALALASVNTLLRKELNEIKEKIKNIL
jgi:hypothetical protein